MCRIRFLILVMALTASTWSICKAAGSFQTKPAFPKVVTAGIAPPLPTLTLPDVSARDLVVAAVGVAAAIPKHVIAVARPISGRRSHKRQYHRLLKSYYGSNSDRSGSQALFRVLANRPSNRMQYPTPTI
jgi:hypothetical protein